MVVSQERFEAPWRRTVSIDRLEKKSRLIKKRSNLSPPDASVEVERVLYRAILCHEFVNAQAFDNQIV